MSFYDRYRNLCAEHGIRPASTAALDAMNLSSANVSLWKTRGYTPNPDALCRIADYFDVSVDYLLERTNVRKPTEQLTETEVLLLNYFRNASETERMQIMFSCGQIIKRQDAESINSEGRTSA